jgi:hypothetical protein
MSDAMWSEAFAGQVAEFLGYRAPGAEEPGYVALDPEAKRIIAAIAETFRYLPAPQTQTVLDYAEFLHGAKIKGIWAPPEHREAWVAEKLREVGDLALFLRQRYGTERPADEKDHWTEEDERDLTAYSMRIWEERENSGEA